MSFAALLLVVSSAAEPKCSLMRPVAPDQTSARRIAEAVIDNVPASTRARAVREAGGRYDLKVEADPDDPNHWIAFESRREEISAAGEVIVFPASHGLGFRIDRCTGKISRMRYQR